MPWTKDKPPAVAKNWTAAEKARCVAAANAALRSGKSDEQAIRACIAAAGKSKKANLSANDASEWQFRLSPPSTLADRFGWQAIGPRTTVQLAGKEVPKQRFLKDIIRTGEYVKASEGLAFTITLATLANWVIQFRKMQANGIKVPIPATHKSEEWEKAAQKKDGDPRDNMGYVDDLWIEEHALWMSCTLVGDDALEAAKRGDVSLNSPAEFIDGHGNVYKRPITHVAMCTDPVVPGLGEFIPLAASLRLQEQAIMLEFLQKLGAILGIDPAEIPDEATAMALIEEKITALVEQVTGEPAAEPGAAGAPGAPTPGAPAAASTGQPGAAVRKQSVTTEYAGAFALDSEGKPNPMVVKTFAENRRMKIEKLLDTRKITPAVRDKMVARWVGKNNEMVGLALARGDDGSDFDAAIEAFEANDPIALKTGEKTGAQSKTVVLSDANKADGDKPNPLVANAEARRKAADEQAQKARR